jgi:glycosyltransferase involved in cell wall biosynthesis
VTQRSDASTPIFDTSGTTLETPDGGATVTGFPRQDRRSEAVQQETRSERPVRILHVLRAMNRGGIETWLMNNLRNIDRERFQMEFLIGTREPSDYDEEIRDLGCPIIPIARPHPSRPWRAAREFLNVLRTRGPYDVVHAHEQELSGYYLRYAARASVPLRIAHSHNDVTRFPGYCPSLGNRLRASMLRRWIDRYATHGLACSRLAAQALFGPGWELEPRWQVFPYGIDLKPFDQPVERDSVRAEFGIEPRDFVIGHVGRLDAQKNHAFLLDIVRDLATRGLPVKLLLLGNGPLRSMIEEKIRSAGLIDRVVLAGVRGDVPRVMLAAMDVFVFPSHFEGLGLVLLEAQAAGLPCVASERVPVEANVDKDLFHTVSLARTAPEWADAVLQVQSARSDRAITFHALQTSGFDIRINVRHLEKLYVNACKQRS